MTELEQAIAEGRRDTRYPPIFVVGCPRSGTTMLANLLDRTPWGWAFETHFVVKYFRRLANYEPLTERANLVRLARAILAERVGTQWEMDLGRPIDVDQLVDTLAEPTYACLVDALCRRSPDRTAPESWGDKTPQYVLDLDVVTTLFPDSKIILMVRDGRDVALSLLGRDWGPRNVAACARYWQACHGPDPLVAQLAAKAQLLELRYERMLHSPREELGRVLDFLGLTARREEVLASVDIVDSRNFDKWRQHMAPKQLRIFEAIAGATLARLGYERVCESPRFGVMESLLYRVHERCSLAWYLFRLNVIDTVLIKFFGKQPFVD